MKRVILGVILLLAAAVHAEELPTTPAMQEQLRDVERQLVQNGLAEADAREMVQALVRAHFSQEQLVQAGRQLAADDRSGLTRQAVRAKIHEGIAKGVTPDTILAATEKVRSRMAYADKLAAELHGKDTVSFVGIYADCLAAGLTEQDAHRLTDALNARRTAPGESENRSLTLEALLTAREMVRRRVSSETATAVLQSALGHNYSGDGLRSLRRSLAGKSGDLENTARTFGAAIDKGMHAGELQGLGGAGGERSGSGSGQGAAGDSGGRGDSGGSSGSSGPGASGGGNSGGGRS